MALMEMRDEDLLILLSRHFGFLEEPRDADLSIIERQIGRPVRGEVFVVFRCPRGCPAVILSIPEGMNGEPVPPLLWLTCPSAVSLVSRFESDGAVGRAAGWLESHRDAAERFAVEEKEFAELYLRVTGGRCAMDVSARLGAKGIAGGRLGSVKCLHAHLAYRLASGRGQVGGWCMEHLFDDEGYWCERKPEACLD